MIDVSRYLGRITPNKSVVDLDVDNRYAYICVIVFMCHNTEKSQGVETYLVAISVELFAYSCLRIYVTNNAYSTIYQCNDSPMDV